MQFLIRSKKYGDHLVTIDDDMSFVVNAAKWVIDIKSENCIYVRGRVLINGQKRLVYLHRFIASAKPNEIIDHINRDTLDNRRCNLRCISANSGINQRNTKLSIKNKTGYKGVHKLKSGKYQSSITIKKQHIFLGVYDTCEAAAAAYNYYVNNKCLGIGGNDGAGVSRPKVRRNNIKKIKGVSTPIKAGKTKPFLAKAMVNKKMYCLGYFATESEAAMFRDKFLFAKSVTNISQYSFPELFFQS